MTRALVVGAGSIGLRHARILTGLGLDIAVVSARTDLDLPVFPTVAAALAARDPAYVVVATATAGHGAAVRELRDAGYGGALLVEKPLAVAETDLAAGVFSRVAVGFNLRFHAVTRRLAELVAGQEVVAVDAYVGQHLSTWRPDRDLAAQYSSRAAEGGGVLRDLSHELDYLTMLFGRCRRIVALGGRFADVTVDSDDAWGILGEFERAPIVTVQLNYLARPGRRRVIVTTPTELIEADFVSGEVVRGEAVERLATERDASYRAMHDAMLTGAGGVASVEDAVEVDRLIADIELSRTTGWVGR